MCQDADSTPLSSGSSDESDLSSVCKYKDFNRLCAKSQIQGIDYVTLTTKIKDSVLLGASTNSVPYHEPCPCFDASLVKFLGAFGTCPVTSRRPTSQVNATRTMDFRQAHAVLELMCMSGAQPREDRRGLEKRVCRV